MITKSELIEYLKHTPENTNYNILRSALYNGSNKEAVDEFIEVLSRGNLSLAALQPYLAKLYEDDKTISPEPLPPFSSGGGSPDAVLYTAQTLTDAQKKQARDNIDAASDFVVIGTVSSDNIITLDKTFMQIREAALGSKRVLIRVGSGESYTYIPLFSINAHQCSFALIRSYRSYISVQIIVVTSDNAVNPIYKVVPVFNSDGTLPQAEMDSDPTEAMQIATKKYVDDALAAIVDGTEVSY